MSIAIVVSGALSFVAMHENIESEPVRHFANSD